MGMAGLDSNVRFPSICSLETLHNALSLKQLDAFLERIVSVSYRPVNSLTPSIACMTSCQDVVSMTSEDDIRSTPPLEVFTTKPPTSFSPSSSLGWSGPPSYVSSGQTSPLNPQIPDLPRSITNPASYGELSVVTLTTAAVEDLEATGAAQSDVSSDVKKGSSFEED